MVELSGLDVLVGWMCCLQCGTHGDAGVWGLWCDDGEAWLDACAMILLVFLRSLNDFCFL